MHAQMQACYNMDLLWCKSISHFWLTANMNMYNNKDMIFRCVCVCMCVCVCVLFSLASHLMHLLGI